jgi:hypothetical protein
MRPPRPLRSVPYVAPDGRTHPVDRGLDHGILDRLNRLPGLGLSSVCAGHGSGRWRPAHVMFLAGRLQDVAPYLDAGVYLAGLGSQSLYRARHEGGPVRWTFTIEAEGGKCPPSRRWWADLADTLEEAAPSRRRSGVSSRAPWRAGRGARSRRVRRG